MRNSILAGLILLGFATAAVAGPDKAELDQRIQGYTTQLSAMQDKPDKKIPPDVLKKARGIILLDRVKGGLVFSWQGGNGVALVRNPKNDKWGPAGFVSGGEFGFGLQGGGQHSFDVILLMTTNSIRMARDSNFEFGGEASGTSGDASANAKGTSNSTDPVVMVYNDSKGFYGGVSVKGDSINPDKDANTAYYGGGLTMRDIISGDKAKISDPTKELIKRLDEMSKK